MSIPTRSAPHTTLGSLSDAAAPASPSDAVAHALPSDAAAPAPHVRVVRLADCPSHMAELRAWFESEWADYYGPGGPGDAAHDLDAFAREEGIPSGLVAVRGDELCGIAVLKPDSIPSLAHLRPWAGAGLVKPDLRRQGIGALLLRGLRKEARRQGYTKIYSATATAETLLQRLGWRKIDSVQHDGVALAIYEVDTGA